MSGNYFHPVLVHGPLVLPFVISLLLMVRWRKPEESFSPLLLLAGIQVVSALAAFYSGSWVGDLLPSDIAERAKSTYEWHYLFGRLTLILSVLVLITLSVFAISTHSRQRFFLLAVCSLIGLCITVVLAGMTGGQLVHEFQLNTLIPR